MNGDANPSAGQSVFSRPPRAQSTPAAATRHAVAARSSAAVPSVSVPDTQRAGISLPDAERRVLEAQRRRGANWFYWIAGLSFVNAVLALSGQGWRFLLGLGITQLVQELAHRSGGTGLKAGIVGIAMIVVFGVLGERAVAGYRWAFVLGMALYALDGCVFLVVRDWPALAFHVFALVMIGRGYVAARRLPSP